MPEFTAYCPVVNRPDLLRNVMEAWVKDMTSELVIIDNSPDTWASIPQPFTLFRPAVPMNFAQTMNWEALDTRRRRAKFFLHMHNDATIEVNQIQQLIHVTRQAIEQERKWVVVFTLYDVLCAYNPDAFFDIGGYDTNFQDYFSDNDFWYRAKLKGYERVESHIPVGHVGSQTINSDPELQVIHRVMFPMKRELYKAKWGGEPDKEKFTEPFNGAAKRIGLQTPQIR